MCVTHGQMFFRNAAEVVEGCQGSRPSSKQSILYLLQGFCCRLLVFNNCTCLLDRIFNLSNQTLKKACQQSGSFGVLSLQIWSEVGQDPPLFCASLKALSKSEWPPQSQSCFRMFDHSQPHTRRGYDHEVALHTLHTLAATRIHMLWELCRKSIEAGGISPCPCRRTSLPAHLCCFCFGNVPPSTLTGLPIVRSDVEDTDPLSSYGLPAS